MDQDIFIAVIAALVNLVLSIVVPCALKNNKDFLPQVRIMLEQHRATLLSSSLLVAVIVYLALKAAPVIQSEIPPGLLNLARLVPPTTSLKATSA
jgi:hypothetical protein